MVKDDASFKLRFTFKKEERLSSKKLIDELFNNGSSFYLYPFKVQYLFTSIAMASPVQVLIAVPNKNFARAVDRNRLKRLTREAFRLNKNKFYDALTLKHEKLLIAFIYTGKKMEPFAFVHEKMNSILNRLSQITATGEKNTE